MPFSWWPFGKVPEINGESLIEALNGREDVQLVDVRTKGEWERSHINGARLVPIHTFKEAMPSLNLDANKPIVVICKTAHRSIPAVRMLTAAGYSAQQLAGGMDAWVRAGLPTETKSSEV